MDMSRKIVHRSENQPVGPDQWDLSNSLFSAQMDAEMPIEFRRAGRALISVSDKTGLIDFARGLAALGIELV